MNDLFIGIDLGGTNIKIGILDSKNSLIKKTAIPTKPEMGPDFVIEQIITTCKSLIAGEDGSLVGVGIGTPGPADYQAGVIIKAANMQNFVNTPIRDMIADGLGVPAMLENDANVACWGEFTLGAGKDIDDMVLFTLGTGIGGAIISKGQLIIGSGCNAAELGHMIIYPDGRQCGCGQKGCVEAYASANSIAARAAEAIQAGGKSSLSKILEEKGTITCKDVFAHADANDELATDIVEAAAKALGIMCVNMLHAVEPERIVFSGGVIAAGAALLNKIKFHFTEQVWNLKPESMEICFATLGEDTGIIGAAALAKHKEQLGEL